ncbi:MAG: efflux RND transporter periplasmic adaptor subunit [Verrucomicrobia bacterium]|nr:efflux RND transporter periplasmic adaptor subunit [Verrucomicrobiota bacterium]
MATPRSAKSSKRRKRVVFAVLALVLAGLTTAALVTKREAVLSVQTEKVTRRNLTELVVANGRIQPVFYVKISPEVSGEIIELAVKEGQAVKKGDLLVRIKPDMYVASRNSSEASYKASLAGKTTAEANLRKAELEYQRIDALFRNNLVSESIHVDAKTGFEIARAQFQSASHQVEMSQAALQRAEEDLRKTTIQAPLDGTVIRLNSQLGERVVGTAMMAGTEMMTIADLSEMEARVDIGEIDVVLIRLGQIVRLEVDAFKDRKFGGTVTEIANSSKGLALGAGGGMGGQSPDATRFEVKIRIAEKEPFRPGMSVMAEIETRYRTNVLTVPIASVTTRMPKPPTEPGARKGQPGAGTNAVGRTNQAAGAAGATNAIASTNLAGGTNALGSTNAVGGTNAVAGRKPHEAPKPIEVVFVKEGDRAKMVPVKRGISDDAYTEILEGLQENQEVVSGGFKAISRELEDGKKVRIGAGPGEASKDKEKK